MKTEENKIVDILNSEAVRLGYADWCDFIDTEKGGMDGENTYNLTQLTASIISNYIKPTDFTNASAPLIKWLEDNHHPMVSAIVTTTSAELFEGMESTGLNLDYKREA